MSIDTIIIDQVRAGALFPLIPKAPGAVARRAMFLVEEVNTALNSPEGDPEWDERMGRLRADLENFATERLLYPKYVFLLYPLADGVWEIRSVKDAPSIRVLGLFPTRDVFVATGIARRDELGGWESREWKSVKRAALAKWRGIFFTYRPIITQNPSDCFSGAINGKYFK